jgi:arylsulfatase A-like enzyme/predicted negative regulator of RcsB-dependent stress response
MATALGRSGAPLLAALAALACGGCGAGGPGGDVPASSGAGSARGFNLLVVTFDTVRADAIGCYGDPQAATPVVDGLAARGVRFAHAVAPAPTTLPSHATLMTGLDPPSHGVRNNGTFTLADERVTLAEMLRERGYATGAVVAAFVLDRRYGLAQGFESYDDALHEDGVDAGEGHFLQRTADRVTDGALAWLAAHGTEPFFLWVHYFDAHAPYRPPGAFMPASGVGRDPHAMFDAAISRAMYLGEVSFADSELGRLLAALGDERLRRTLVVFAGDHGEGLGEHGEFTHSRLVYEASMRVPLIFSCPALFDRGHVVDDRVAGLVDVLPTVLSMLGIQSGGALDGVALNVAAADPARAIYGESLVPLLNHGWAPLFCLRRLDDKLIGAPRPEYYDLRADPRELRNLHAQSPPAAAELERALSARLASSLPPGAAQERALGRDEERRLAALGYSRSVRRGADYGVLDPKDMIVTWAVLSNAQTYSAQGDFDRALAEVDKVLALEPNDAFAWETAYVVHLRKQSLEEAEGCLRRVLELNPTYDGYVRLAELLLQRGTFDEFEAVLAKAAGLDPLHGDVFLIRGDRYLGEKRYDLAREQFERALAVDPARAAAGARRGLAYIEKQRASER